MSVCYKSIHSNTKVTILNFFTLIPTYKKYSISQNQKLHNEGYAITYVH